MTLVNNEGKQITVTTETLNEVIKCYNEGVWAVIVKDTKGNPHSVIVPDQMFII